MSTRELIELAVLDALSLLDEDESRAFDAAFENASPGVREMVRREQARLSRMEMILPDVEPDPSLRDRVLTAVRAAMVEHAPIAHIGGRRSPEIIPSRRVSPVWRAAAIGLLTAAVVFAGTTIQLRNEHERLLSALQNDRLINELLKEHGHDFTEDLLFDNDTQRIVFNASLSESKAEASLFSNPDWRGNARLFCSHLPAHSGQSYRLVVLDENGEVVDELTSFQSTGGLVNIEVAINPATLPPSRKLAVLEPANDKPHSKVLEATLGTPGMF